MWTPGGQTCKDKSVDSCGTCGSEVKPDQHGLQCDFCNT